MQQVQCLPLSTQLADLSTIQAVLSQQGGLRSTPLSAIQTHQAVPSLLSQLSQLAMLTKQVLLMQLSTHQQPSFLSQLSMLSQSQLSANTVLSSIRVLLAQQIFTSLCQLLLSHPCWIQLLRYRCLIQSLHQHRIRQHHLASMLLPRIKTAIHLVPQRLP